MVIMWWLRNVEKHQKNHQDEALVPSAARDPSNLTSTDNKTTDGCRSWMDASNASFWPSREVWISWKHCPSIFPPWSPPGPLSGTIVTLTDKRGQSYSRKLPWETLYVGSQDRTEIPPGKRETNTMPDKSLWHTLLSEDKPGERRCSMRHTPPPEKC